MPPASPADGPDAPNAASETRTNPLFVDRSWHEPRTVLALAVTLFSLLIVGLLAQIAIQSAQTASVQTVLSAVLPLVGTWVGTVLAFYFSKDNFESAARNYVAIRQATAEQRLASTPVATAMIPVDRLDVFPTDNVEAVKLSEALEFLNTKNRRRLIVVDQSKKPLAVVHRSYIDEFLVRNAIPAAAGGAAKTAADFKLKDLFDVHAALRTSSYCVVRQDGNLAQVKEKMSATPDCQDCFVTASGTAHEPIVGWLTNIDIEKYSKA
jgi:hypothetical protein